MLGELMPRYFIETARLPGTLPTTVDEFHVQLLRMSEEGARAVISPTPEERHYLTLPSPVRTNYTAVMAAVVMATHRNCCPSARRLWLLVNENKLRGIMWDNRRKPLTELPALIEEEKRTCRARTAAARFLAISVTITQTPDAEPEGPSHVNLLLLDMRTDTLYHFEPHGATADSDVAPRLASVFGYRYVWPSELACPTWIQNDDELPFQGKEPLCPLWALLFLETILSVPDLISIDRAGAFADFIFDTFSPRPAVPNPVICVLLFLYLRVNKALDWFEREMMIEEIVERFPDVEEEDARAAITPEQLAAYRINRTLPPPAEWAASRKRRTRTYRSASVPRDSDVKGSYKRFRAWQAGPVPEDPSYSDEEEGAEPWDTDPAYRPYARESEIGFYERFGAGGDAAAAAAGDAAGEAAAAAAGAAGAAAGAAGAAAAIPVPLELAQLRVSPTARVPLYFAKLSVPTYRTNEDAARRVLDMSGLTGLWRQLVGDPDWGTRRAVRFIEMIDESGLRDELEDVIKAYTLDPATHRVFEEELAFELYLRKSDVTDKRGLPLPNPRTGNTESLDHMVSFTMLETPTVHGRRA